LNLVALGCFDSQNFDYSDHDSRCIIVAEYRSWRATVASHPPILIRYQSFP
jgi:hypothetical protein